MQIKKTDLARVAIVLTMIDLIDTIDFSRGWALPDGATDDGAGFSMWTHSGCRVDFGGTGAPGDPRATVSVTFHAAIDPEAPESKGVK